MTDSSEIPIKFKIRHLSPMGVAFNRPLWDNIFRNNKRKNIREEGIIVELAGVKSLIQSNSRTTVLDPKEKLLDHMMDTQMFVKITPLYQPVQVNCRYNTNQSFPEPSILGCIHYRSKSNFLFEDLAMTLTKIGSMGVSSKRDSVDTIYYEKLKRLELEAAKERMGMWADKNTCADNPDLMEQVELESNRGSIEKIWSFLNLKRIFK